MLRQLEQGIKRLSEKGATALSEFADDALIKNMLYYIATSDRSVSYTAKICKLYQLDQALPDEHTLKQIQTLDVPDGQAVHSVVQAILSETATIKDNIEQVVRHPNAGMEELTSVTSALKQVADTLAALGLASARNVVNEQWHLLNKVLLQQQMPADDSLMDMAAALLNVEAHLMGDAKQGQLDSFNSSLQQMGIDDAQAVLLIEARNTLEQTKDDIVAFIGSQWDHRKIAAIPENLHQIHGGLSMIPLPQAAQIIAACSDYFQQQLLEQKRIPDWDELDTIADVVMAIDYYLERLTEDGRGTNISLLQTAKSHLESLGVTVSDWQEPNMSDAIK